LTSADSPYQYPSSFSPFAQIFRQPKAFPDSVMPRAKRAKFRKSNIFFTPLASFARDIPNFDCGYAALCRPNTFCGSLSGSGFMPIRRDAENTAFQPFQ